MSPGAPTTGVSDAGHVTSPSKLKDLLVVASVAGTTFLNSFFSGALTSALPTIQKDLGFTPASLQWPPALYSLVLGSLLLPSGQLADVYGHRALFLAGTVMYFAVSVGVALAPNSIGFSALCALLGIAAAANTPAGVGVLGSYFSPGPAKNQAFASLGAGQPVGFIAGLIVGAVMTDTKVGWRGSFYIQAGLGALFGVIAFFAIPPTFALDPTTIPLTDLAADDGSVRSTSATGSHPVNKGVDWVGAILSVAGLVLLTFALADASSEPRGWKTPFLPPLVPISVGILALFFYWESLLARKLAQHYDTAKEGVKRKPPPPPLLAPAIWKAPHVASILAIVFFSWSAFNTSTYYVNLVLQLVMSVSAIKTALYFLPMIIAGTALNFLPALLMGRVSGRVIIIGAMFLSVISPVLLACIDTAAPYWQYLFPIMVLAPATDIIFPVCTIQISKSVPRSQQATAGALFNVTTRLATSMSLAVISSVANAVSAQYLSIATVELGIVGRKEE
ncbi:hypothetical protein ACM66B_003779 [Microbotryomycetes sp. NB124-2]